ncbi:AEC family transporter [Pseudomaricurvus sp. HS19]|uniref:AEC family transporter n=1 Tax=Pseudomaricurvus sp. HS19 TaxID=2692626 RepID=UPI00136B987B|nr:AEC family transporter [Pseudomaricurvus sp. HS19]MYM62247.1 hypothetical protein [Pseudomaricurvus sp. HS19]
MLATLQFSLSVTLPIFGWLVLGLLLRQLRLINTLWTSRMSSLVFYVSLPLLMFSSVVRFPISDILQPAVVSVTVAVTLLIWLLARQLNRYRKVEGRQAAVIEQAAFRGNLGIVGISLCLNAYGSELLAQVSLLMAVLTLVYNLLSVYVFVAANASGKVSVGQLLSRILSNPLILGLLAGGLVALATTLFPALQMPQWWFVVTDYWIQWTLPLALIAIGASLGFGTMRRHWQVLSEVAGFKLLLMPLLSVVTLLALGWRGETIGMVFLLCASPTAAVSYVMAKAYGGDAELAANLVAVITLVSLPCISLGVFILKFWSLM